MKLACDKNQALELKRLYDFPEPDLVMEFFWAADTHPYHMKRDEKLLHKDEDVDIIPAWSLGRMIEGLPCEICVCEDEDELETVVYELQIIPVGEGMLGRDHNLATVRYALYDNSEALYETVALELVDALYEMIMKLHENGWYIKREEEEDEPISHESFIQNIKYQGEL